MTVPAVQKRTCNFHKKELILTGVIMQLYTSKPVKTTKLDQGYHKYSLNKHYTALVVIDGVNY